MEKQKSATARRIRFALAIMKTNIHLPMAAMFLTAVLAGPAAAENQVPFKGRLEGVVSITPIDAQFSFVRINGTGNATHLGLFRVEIPHLVDRQARTGIGTYVFTAANGDMLTADFTGQATPTVTPTVLSIVEIASITGGTGQFADASGSFIVTRSFNVATGLTTGSFQGTISSPGADKP
jgi:hypothetical protein